MSPKLYLLLITLILPLHIFAQNAEWMQFTSGKINDMAADSENIWLATEGGLVKFNKNSKEIERFNIFNSDIQDNNVRGIAIDNESNIWLAMQKGLSKFDGANWTNYNTENTLINNLFYLFSISIDSSDNIWLGKDDGALKFDGTNWTEYSSEESGVKYPMAVEIDRDGNIWFGIPDGFVKYDGVNWTKYDSAAIGARINIRDIAFDSGGNVWMATYTSGIAMFDKTNVTVYDSNYSEYPFYYVYSIAVDENDQVWAGTNAGLMMFDGDSWENYSKTNPSVDHYDVQSILIDEQQRKYFGFTDGRLGIVDNEIWQDFNTASSGLRDQAVLSITLDKNGNIFFNPRGVIKFDGNEWTSYSSGMQSSVIFSIAVDNDDNIWAATQYGAEKFDGTSWELYNNTNSVIPYGNVNSVTAGHDGHIIFGTDKGAVICDGNNWKLYHESNSDLPTNQVYGTFIDQSDNMWFATVGGAAKYNGSDWTVYNTGNSGIPSYQIYSINENTATGEMLFSTALGLGILDGNDWTVYDTSNSGIPEMSISCSEVDNEGNIWVGTNQGAAKFDGTDWAVYTTENSAFPCNYIYCIKKDSSGNLWFGTEEGVAAYKPGGVILSVEEKEKIYSMMNSYNYPNPFTNSTKICFEMETSGDVIINIYDAQGKIVSKFFDGFLEAGSHSLDFSGNELPNGMYYYEIISSEGPASGKMLLIK